MTFVMPRVSILFVFFSILLVGCVPTKPSDLKKESAPHYSFETDQPLDAVFSIIQSRLEQCYVKPLTASEDALVDVVSEKQHGKMEVYYLPTGKDGFYIFGIFMTAQSPEKTAVRVAYHSPWANGAESVKRWVENDYKECLSHAYSDNPEEGMKGYKTYSFEIAKEHKQTFDILSNGLTSCLDGRDAIGKTSYIVDSLYDASKKEGYTTVGYHGFSFEYRMQVISRDIGNSRSAITVRYNEEFIEFAKPIEKWLKTATLPAYGACRDAS